MALSPTLCTLIAVSLLAFVDAKFISNEDRIDGYDWPCPAAENISPCVCTDDVAYNININCSMVTSEEELLSSFDATFPFDDVARFSITNDGMVNDIRNLSQGIFGEKSFETVIISGTNLEIIEDNVFSKSEDTLVYLQLDNNQISLFIFESLQNYPGIWFLDLHSNQLTSLPQIVADGIVTLNLNNNRNLQLSDGVITFEGVPNLNTLRLSSVDLGVIRPNLFATNAKLEELYLSSNGIETLEANAINPPSELTKLYLDDNGLKNVLPGAISGLAADCELSLANNQITELHSDAWQTIFSAITAGEINLENNPLVCGCDMHWIITNTAFWSTISEGTTCYDGSNVHDLIPEFFESECLNETGAARN